MHTRLTPLTLLAIGLLLLSSGFLLRHWLPLSDWVAGMLAGIGIGLEPCALGWAARLRAPRG